MKISIEQMSGNGSRIRARFFGKGFLSGNIVNSGLLPFAFTDFTFAGFAEQFGFAGSLLIILLCLILIIRMFLIYKNADTDFNKHLYWNNRFNLFQFCTACCNEFRNYTNYRSTVAAY